MIKFLKVHEILFMCINEELVEKTHFSCKVQLK